MSNNHDTVSTVLSDTHLLPAEAHVLYKAGLASTASFRPATAEAESANNNPTAVSGRVSAFRSPTPLIPATSPYRMVRNPDGRYVFEPEVIIGPDDRVRVNNTSSWPYPVHGHMIMQFPNGRTYIGTGTMVNRHHVLTAGHCVHSAADGGWATSIQFNAAQNDGSLPFGSSFATRLLSVSGWTDSHNSDYDFGMLILGNELGNNTGYFGIITFGSDAELTSSRVNVTGYPGDKGGRQMWTHSDAIKRTETERFFYDIDTMGGQSGSGVWSTWAGHDGEKVAGIHTTGSSSGNGATRISRWKFDKIVEWFQQF